MAGLREYSPKFEGEAGNNDVNSSVKAVCAIYPPAKIRKYKNTDPINDAYKTKIDPEWVPSEEALEILKMSQVSDEFHKNKLREFRLYWQERGQERNNWNTSFIDYIRREWAKDQSSNKGLPFSISSDWVPSEDVYDILELSDIKKESAIKYLREFILYWKMSSLPIEIQFL